jgi:hypothetical protein
MKMNKEIVTPSVPVKATTQSFEANRGYVKRNIGYPVEPGQTWHDLTMEQRQDWMRQRENSWRMKFMADNAQSNLGWTRG